MSADEAYTKWLNEDNDPILWIHGEDGQGKTPLTISLINALTDKVERSSQKRALAYFFCAAQDRQRNNVTAMIRILLCQLLNDQTRLNHGYENTRSKGIQFSATLVAQ